MKDGEKISKIIYFLNIKLIEKIYSFSIDFGECETDMISHLGFMCYVT